MDQLFVAFEFTLLGFLLATVVGWLFLGRRPEAQPVRVAPVLVTEPAADAARFAMETREPTPVDIPRLAEAISRKSGLESAQVADVVKAALALEREIHATRAGSGGVQGATPALSAAFDALCDSLGPRLGAADDGLVPTTVVLPKAQAEPDAAAAASAAQAVPVEPAPVALVQAPAAADTMAPVPPAPRRAPSATAPLILVVDDSVTVRVFAQRLLRAAGYRVVLAEDGLDALDRLKQERPSVVLADIEMPRMDGFDLARHIRADSSLASLPIIMITSRIAHKHREYARQIGVNHYLGKPYAPDEMIQLVRRYATVAPSAALA